VRAALAIVAGLGIAWALSRAADQAAAAGVVDVGGEGDDGTTALDWANPWGAIERQVDTYQTEQAMRTSNLPAFQTMISVSEGTARAADPYAVCYGYRHTVQDYSQHPAVSGEWKGEPLDNLGAAYVGKVSTAAGRYQIIKPTWLAAARALGLTDFSPASQDAACAWLIKNRGAVDDIEAGRIEDAIAKCRPEWASLPGAGYGQPERKTGELLAAYERAGGTLA
jgi:lysozyme